MMMAVLTKVWRIYHKFCGQSAALSYPHEFLFPSPRVFFTMGEGQGMRAYTLTPYPSPKIKAFWERGIILLKIRGDSSERSVPTLQFRAKSQLCTLIGH